MESFVSPKSQDNCLHSSLPHTWWQVDFKCIRQFNNTLVETPFRPFPHATSFVTWTIDVYDQVARATFHSSLGLVQFSSLKSMKYATSYKQRLLLPFGCIVQILRKITAKEAILNKFTNANKQYENTINLSLLSGFSVNCVCAET